ncbi:AAA family ATPase [Gorillibacterium massiliense]|uniref:AAA family ATPase n=1 Tax=Gorillibacterium massiliense TaxID=1280390 RepID=UPI0004BC1F77|nr:AAA family ATPase [Gorillibacterium massiliense]
MSKYIKEIVIGIGVAALLFLVYIGVNVLPFLTIAAFVGVFFYFSRPKGSGAMTAGVDRRTKAKVPTYLTFDDIGGQDRAKNELKEALDFLIKQEEIKKFGIRPLKGILLEGPPGTGKTLMAKAAAQHTNSVFLSASGSEFVEMYVGVGASRIRDLFKDARTRAQKENKDSAIIFIDEIDVIGGKRDGGGQHREYDQTLNQLLTEMDGIHTQETPRILLMAATNRKEMLDSALLRPGRFDRHISVDLPDKKGRLHILNLHAKNKPLAMNVDLEKVAEESFNFSGAQLESLMNEAAVYAMREESPYIETRHMSAAVDKVMMGERSDRESSKAERERVALHELGHAIMAEVTTPGSVAQVSLRPRGQALGYVRHNPSDDQYLYTKQELENRMMVALGGAVAEEMFYGNRSTGSRNDFDQVLHMVKMMMDSGLTNLGIIDRDMVTKDELMKENQRIVEQQTSRTREILERHRDVFQQSLSILTKEEELSGTEFRSLFKQINQRTTA